MANEKKLIDVDEFYLWDGVPVRVIEKRWSHGYWYVTFGDGRSSVAWRRDLEEINQAEGELLWLAQKL